MKTAREFLQEFFGALEDYGVTMDEVIVGGRRAFDGVSELDQEVDANWIAAGFSCAVRHLGSLVNQSLMWAISVKKELHGGDIAVSLVEQVIWWRKERGVEDEKCSLRSVVAKFIHGFLNGDGSEEDPASEAIPDAQDVRTIELEEDEAILVVRIGALFSDHERAKMLAQKLIKNAHDSLFMKRLVDELARTHGEKGFKEVGVADLEMACMLIETGGATPRGRRMLA